MATQERILNTAVRTRQIVAKAQKLERAEFLEPFSRIRICASLNCCSCASDPGSTDDFARQLDSNRSTVKHLKYVPQLTTNKLSVPWLNAGTVELPSYTNPNHQQSTCPSPNSSEQSLDIFTPISPEIVGVTMHAVRQPSVHVWEPLGTIFHRSKMYYACWRYPQRMPQVHIVCFCRQ